MKLLQFDLLKSYVRLPDLQQKRVTEFAHSIGVPVTTHEIYPAAFVGVDATEHTSATSRRGYSPKQATLARSYEDVIQLFGQSQRYLTPTVPAPGLAKLLADEPEMKNDPRFTIYSDWLRLNATGQSRARGVLWPEGDEQRRSRRGPMVVRRRSLRWRRCVRARRLLRVRILRMRSRYMARCRRM